MKPKDGYTAKQKVIIGVWAGILVWILAMTIRSTDWRFADRSSVGLAPLPEDEKGAVVQVYAARTYNWRGYFAVHPWIAVKKKNENFYTVYQVTAWNLYRGKSAVSIERDIPDRYWYGKRPQLLQTLKGEEAQKAIPAIEKAVREYPFADRYQLWPGPNSNTFVAYVLREVPELTVELPPTAIGKDFLGYTVFHAPTPSGTGEDSRAGEGGEAASPSGQWASGEEPAGSAGDARDDLAQARQLGAGFGFEVDEQTHVAHADAQSDLLAAQAPFASDRDSIRELSLAIAMVMAAGIRRNNIRSALRVSHELAHGEENKA